MNVVLQKSTKLDALLQTNPSHRHVSIYLPTHFSSRSETINADSARFKSLLQNIKKNPDLHRHDESITKTVQSLEKLIKDRSFWSKQTAGLAVFANQDHQHIIHLPFEVSAQCYVSNKFITTPLLGMQTLMEELYALEVNLKQPKLYKATGTSLSSCDDVDLPGSLEDALQLDEFQQMQQHHTGEGHGRAMFHGHGGADDNKEKDIETYLRLLAKKVDAYLKNSRDPLLLVGTKQRTASLRKKLTYKQLLEQEVTGSYDSPQDENTLLEHIHHLMQERIDRHQTDFLETFKSAYGNELAVAGQAAVDQAAEMDNVKTLLLPLLRRTKDSVRDGNEEQYIFELSQELPNLEDTVRACRGTRAEIIPVRSKKTTPDDDVAAVCRFKLTIT